MYGTNVHNFNILNSGLGGVGSRWNNYCIMQGEFARGQYQALWCDHDNSCCLRRNPEQFYSYPTAADMINRILTYTQYGGDTSSTGDIGGSIDGYRESIEGRPHAVAHTATAGSSQFHLGSFYSPDDPIFYLLHTFVDYNWALWQDCHNFDQLDISSIHDQCYVGGLATIQQGGPSRLDDPLHFPVLVDQSWAKVGKTGFSITPRSMHSIQSNFLQYSYEKGNKSEKH